jgi:RHS repeat-associated protein
LVGSVEYDAFGDIRAQSGVASAFGYTGELYTPATGLLHLRARDLNPALGRFLSVDTVQPNAPGSQGFNVYSYVASNPTTWVDPSGHFGGLSGYLGTAAFAPNIAVLGAVTAMSIEGVLALGRNPASWRFPENFRTSGIVFATFALILACALTPGCMSVTGGAGGIIAGNGSDSPYGATPWSPSALPNASDTHPELPSLPFQINPVTNPSTTTGTGTSPNGSPDPNGPPGWFWPAALLAALAAITTWVMPGPGRNPIPGLGTGPASDPFSTPGPTATPTEDPTCAQDVNYLIDRAEYIHKGLHQWGIENLTTAVLRVKMKDGSCLDYVGGSDYKITKRQQGRMISGREVIAPLIHQHAEETVIQSARVDYFADHFIAMGVSREICDWWNCRPLIAQTGGSIHASQRGATWP